MKLIIALAFGIVFQIFGSTAIADEHNKINLKLMTKKSVIGSDG